MQRLAAALLGALVVGGGFPWASVGPGAPAAACVGGTAAMRTVPGAAGVNAGSTIAGSAGSAGTGTAAHRPACRMSCCKVPARAGCTCGRGRTQLPRQASLAGTTPSILPAPPRLPPPPDARPSWRTAPARLALAWHDLPERPPRA